MSASCARMITILHPFSTQTFECRITLVSSSSCLLDAESLLCTLISRKQVAGCFPNRKNFLNQGCFTGCVVSNTFRVFNWLMVFKVMCYSVCHLSIMPSTHILEASGTTVRIYTSIHRIILICYNVDLRIVNGSFANDGGQDSISK